MIDNISNFKDLNNISIKIKIGRKSYESILIANENSLILSINMTKDLDTWRKCSKDYDILTGNLCCNNKKITLINCIYIGKNSTGASPVLLANIEYQIDRILIGKKLTKQECKNIRNYEVCYDNIDCLTNDKPYSFVGENSIAFESTPTRYEFNIKNCHMIIDFSSHINQSSDSLLISRKTLVTFTNSNKINIVKALNNIYILRNFLMILLKKDISVEKQYIFFESERIQLIDCNNNVVNKLEKNIENHFKYCGIKIENISNLSEIYQLFYNNYNKLYPLLEQYYNVTKYKVPELIRVVNSITMLEYYSRAFDNKSALALTKSKKQTTKKSNIKDAEFKDRVISLITKVNCIFNLSSSEIDTISENIKNARIYYIHYKDKSTVKKLSYEEQFKYAYFIQDIVLLNLYTFLKLDINSHSFISFLGYYYNTKDLL